MQKFLGLPPEAAAAPARKNVRVLKAFFARIAQTMRGSGTFARS
jgi:hypothetical protein